MGYGEVLGIGRSVGELEDGVVEAVVPEGIHGDHFFVIAGLGTSARKLGQQCAPSLAQQWTQLAVAVGHQP
jgi:hypothetical protein